jgi:hypothetical protein
MEAVYSSETFVYSHKISLRNDTEEHDVYSHGIENLKFRIAEI